MRKSILGGVLACGFLLSAAPALAQGGCSENDLNNAADRYLEAQAIGDPSPMPLGTWVTYNEQMDLGTLSTGVISKKLKVDFSRRLIDTTACQVYLEVIVTDPAHPYVLGVTLTARGGQVGTIDMVATDKGDWLFNAPRTLAYSKAEDWGVIPEGQRDTRAVIRAAADALSRSVQRSQEGRAWGSPCARLEGRMYTGKGANPGDG